MTSKALLNFTRHFLLTAKILSAELARVVYSEKKFTVIIFRNVVTVKVGNENLREL